MGGFDQDSRSLLHLFGRLIREIDVMKSLVGQHGHPCFPK